MLIKIKIRQLSITRTKCICRHPHNIQTLDSVVICAHVVITYNFTMYVSPSCSTGAPKYSTWHSYTDIQHMLVQDLLTISVRRAPQTATLLVTLLYGRQLLRLWQSFIQSTLTHNYSLCRDTCVVGGQAE